MEASKEEQDCLGLSSCDGRIEDLCRSFRAKKKQVDPIYCPICSITLRGSEIDIHVTSEIERLSKISNTKPRANGKANRPSTSATNHDVHEFGKEWETYQKVRSNRHRRLRLKTRKRNLEAVICPICNEETLEEINSHIENCFPNDLQLNSLNENNIVVEDNFFEEYEWAGESRVRATSLLSGGVSSLGISLGSTDEDELLVVDGDDSNAYGIPQYSEKDIRFDIDGEQKALPTAFLAFNEDFLLNSEISPPKNDFKQDINGDQIVEALKNRIRELEHNCIEDAFKCLICMERYKTPVISICCWHVHCEHCWLQTLGAKKLCPQCNTITSPTDLRRIYM